MKGKSKARGVEASMLLLLSGNPFEEMACRLDAASLVRLSCTCKAFRAFEPQNALRVLERVAKDGVLAANKGSIEDATRWRCAGVALPTLLSSAGLHGRASLIIFISLPRASRGWHHINTMRASCDCSQPGTGARCVLTASELYQPRGCKQAKHIDSQDKKACFTHGSAQSCWQTLPSCC